MLIRLFLGFTLIPVAEIYLLITIGGYIGAVNTVLLVIITGFIGAYLARLQGMQTMFRIRQALQDGVLPSGELIEAFLIFVAGIVLLTPGFITDIAGIALLVPFLRSRIRSAIMNRLNRMIENRHIQFRQYP